MVADEREVGSAIGVGAPLVRFAVAAAAARGGHEMEAYIQPANVTFFRWLGWRPAGGLVDYASIPHQRMLIDLAIPARVARTPPGHWAGPGS